MDSFSIAIDIGAGLGVKIGLFADPHTQIDEGLLPLRGICERFQQFPRRAAGPARSNC